jgi:hypothetical protein
MSTSIKPKRGLESTRANQTPTAGELTYVVDTNKIYFGDGSTAGGIEADYMDKTNDESIAGNKTFTDNLIVDGNITVNGTATTVNSNEVNIGDSQIVLNSDEVGTPSQDGGVEIERGTSTNAKLIWDEATDKWQFGIEGDMQDIASDADVTNGLAALESYDQSLNTTDDVLFKSVEVGTPSDLQVNSIHTDTVHTHAGTGYIVSQSAGDATALFNDIYNNLGILWQHGAGEWAQYQFTGEQKVITSYRLYISTSYPTRIPVDSNFLGSNDGTNWDTLLEVRGDSDWGGGWKDFDLTTTGSYEYYRFEIVTGGSAGLAYCRELQLISSVGTIVVENGTVDGRDLSVDGALLDSIDGGSYDATFNNLTVNGTTTTVNSNEVNIGDNTIILNSDETGTPSQDGGFEVERGTETNASLIWDETDDVFKAGLKGAEERMATKAEVDTASAEAQGAGLAFAIVFG